MSISAQLDDLSAMARAEKSDPQHVVRRRANAELSAIFEIAHQIGAMPTYAQAVDYNEVHTNEMTELVTKVESELKSGDAMPVILLRTFNGIPEGTVANVAQSEAAWLIRCGAARAATDAEIAEACANSAPTQPPLKSWTRYRNIKNKCQALREPVRVQ